MQLIQNKEGYPTVSWQRRSFYPQWKAFSQAIYIQSIEPQTLLSAGYPPPQMKNHLIIGKAQRKGIYTKILSKALLDITLKNKFTLWSKCLSWNLIFLRCFFFVCPWLLGISWPVIVTPVTHLLLRQSIFPKLTLFLYLTLFITYLSFCFNCKCRSVNIYQLFHLTPCYKRAFFYTNIKMLEQRLFVWLFVWK